MGAKISQDEFVYRATAVHSGRYGYGDAVYKTGMDKVEITCPVHGNFQQRAANHLLGIGCPKCANIERGAKCSDDRASFIAKAKDVHGDRYGYDGVDYRGSQAKVKITCPVHGVFTQRPNAHLLGGGCPRCAGKGMTTADFVARAVAVHGDRFDYSRTSYRAIKEPVTITCSVHGEFEQTAENHLTGRGCRFCWYEDMASDGERELAAWVEGLGVRVVRNDRVALGGVEIDAYLPESKLGIEFNGCYWHSDRHPKGKQHQAFKAAAGRAAGVRIVNVWDFDWLHRREVVKEMIAHAVGAADKRRIDARACKVSEVTQAEANALYESHHIQGGVRGGVCHFGLSVDGGLVAAMTFARGGARRGKAQDGEWELARYATSDLVRGGAGRLFAAFVRERSPDSVWSFSDSQHFSGGVYPALGFANDGPVPSSYTVVHPGSLRSWHKSLWKRSCIPARMRDLGLDADFDPETDPRTEHAMQDAIGVLRCWDAGKTRWVWQS